MTPWGIALFATLAAAAAGLGFVQSRRIAREAAGDRELLVDLRATIERGMIREARDLAKAHRGAAARVVLDILRFPHGVHREAIERALGESLLRERSARQRQEVPFWGLAAAVAGGTLVNTLGPWSLFSSAMTAAAAAGAALTVVAACWWRVARISGEARKWVERESTDIARLVLAFAESPAMVEVRPPAEEPAVV